MDISKSVCEDSCAFPVLISYKVVHRNGIFFCLYMNLICRVLRCNCRVTAIHKLTTKIYSPDSVKHEPRTSKGWVGVLISLLPPRASQSLPI